MNVVHVSRFLSAFLIGLGLAAGGSAATAQNLVVNGDFALGGDPPSGWTREKETARKGAMRVANNALELAPNASNTPSDKPLGVGQAIDATSLAGKTLAVSARLGLRAPAVGAVVGLHALRADGSQIGMVQLRRSQAGDGPETATGTLAIPAGDKPKLLILYAVVEGLGGIAQFASISVAPETAPAAAPAARGEPLPVARGEAVKGSGGGSAYAAKVTVDAGGRGRTIPRALYGSNIEWWRNANGVWDSNGDRLKPEALRLSKALGTSLIRFPGGYLGDIYDWREAMGPRRNRKAIVTHPANRDKDVPYFGTEEVIQFAGAIGADLMLQANLGTGDAKMAADWVRHMKEQQQRNPAGPRVQSWEMGNELYHKEDVSGRSLSPEAYADKLVAFAREMRAVDPTIRLGAIGGENYPAFQFNSYRNWNEIVLKRAGAEIDYIALHNGYAPVAPDDRANPRDVYRALWAAPLMVADNLRTVGEQIRRYAPPGRADRIRIAVTEWAPLFHIAPSSAWIDHSKTLGSALYVADVLRVFIQDERVEAATYFKLSEASFLGLLGMRRGEWIPNATYYAMQLYTEHFGTTVVSSRTEAPTYDSVKAGIVPAMKRVPLLESVASVSADGSRLFVMLINKSVDQSADVNLGLSGFDAASGAAHLLSGASPDANTGAELPKVPGLRWARQVNVDESARHFDRGAPSEVTYTSMPLPAAGRSLTYRLPPHSVASIELRLRR